MICFPFPLAGSIEEVVKIGSYTFTSKKIHPHPLKVSKNANIKRDLAV